MKYSSARRLAYLFGEQLLTQSVEADELARQQTSVDEAFCHQHDLTDELKVWDHHGTGPEVFACKLFIGHPGLVSLNFFEPVMTRPKKSLKVFREFGPASVTWVEGDENPNGWLQLDLLIEKYKPAAINIHIKTFKTE